MFRKTIVGTIGMLCLFLTVFAQNKNVNIHPLNVGDNVPESFWKTAMQVVNHPQGISSITLDDYRKNKLLILDFWSTYCGTCIAAMLRLDSLNKELSDKVIILPVNRQAKDKVQEFAKRNEVFRTANMLSVVADTYLAPQFPHVMVPHEVWIMDGKIKAITGGDEVNREQINRLVQKGNLTIATKKDVLGYDYRKPFLLNGNGGNEDTFLYRSIFTPYRSGLSSINGSMAYKAGTWRFLAINTTILDLYRLAFKELDSIPQDRIIIEDGPISLYQPNIKGEALQRWNSQNLYCYESIVPSTATGPDYSAIKEDLDRYLNLHSRLEVRHGTTYFILSAKKP